MVTENRVSLEIAKILKEKGFNEDTDFIYYYYEEDDGWCYERLLPDEMFDSEKMLHCPTHQMVMKWLRQTYEIQIDIESAFWSLLSSQKWRYAWKCQTVEMIRRSDFVFDIYERAVEAALEYCLDQLI